MNWKAALPYAVIGVLGLGLKCSYDGNIRSDAERRLLSRQLASRADSIGQLLLRLSARYRVDTVRLTETVVERQLVRDTLRIEEWLRDTIRVPVEVVRTALSADSAVIQACFVALNTCEQEKALLRRRMVIVDSMAFIWKSAAQPSLWQQTQSTARTVAGWELLKVVVRAVRR